MLKKGFFTSYGMQHANQIKISIKNINNKKWVNITNTLGLKKIE